MNRDYYYLNNYSGAGLMGISRRAFESIATTAANEVEHAKVAHRNSRLFQLSHPVKASFRKNGKVELNIDVSISKGAEVHAVSLAIQEAVASAISMMCETVPIAVEIKVVTVK